VSLSPATITFPWSRFVIFAVYNKPNLNLRAAVIGQKTTGDNSVNSHPQDTTEFQTSEF
jgi:hypothetical protein